MSETIDHARTLALLDEGAREADANITALKAQWAHEDEATAAARVIVLAAHDQGARDRDAMRARLTAVREFRAEPPGPGETLTYVAPEPPDPSED